MKLSTKPLHKPRYHLDSFNYTKEDVPATALPILDIQEPVADLASKTSFIKLQLGNYLVGLLARMTTPSSDIEQFRAACFQEAGMRLAAP
jgi:hypothetical protein